MENSDKLLSKFKACLTDIKSDKSSLDQSYSREEFLITLPKEITPQAYMVFISLVFLAGFEYWGKHEKQLWAIPVRYKSVSFLLTHRKFGFHIYSYKNEERVVGLATELIKKINTAFKYAEQLIQPLLNEQIKKGNITITNKYIALDMMYRFFRTKARNAFRRNPPKKKVLRRDKTGKPIAWSGDPFRPTREGFYYSIATIDAFFSRLEHILILAIPFVHLKKASYDLPKMISSNWTDKYKRIFDLHTNKLAMQYYDELKKIKDKYRNTIAHGFFEKDCGSLFFHFGPVGAIPVYLSRFEESIHYSFYPITEFSFADICKFFDKFDKFLRTSSIKYAIKYAKSGLSVSFSEECIKEYAAASGPDIKFNSFLEHESYIADMYDNMDW